LGGSEKENTSLIKNAIVTSGDEDPSAEEMLAAVNQTQGHEKIQNVLE
jgi:hypothetical protein